MSTTIKEKSLCAFNKLIQLWKYDVRLTGRRGWSCIKGEGRGMRRNHNEPESKEGGDSLINHWCFETHTGNMFVVSPSIFIGI